MAKQLSKCHPLSLLSNHLYSLFNERNEEFSGRQLKQFGPVNEDIDPKTHRLREESKVRLSLTKKQAKEIED